MPDPSELEAEARLLGVARERLTPAIKMVREMFPDAADCAVLVTFEAGAGARVPLVIATDRWRVARDMAHYADTVLAERPHDRGRD